MGCFVMKNDGGLKQEGAGRVEVALKAALRSLDDCVGNRLPRQRDGCQAKLIGNRRIVIPDQAWDALFPIATSERDALSEAIVGCKDAGGVCVDEFACSASASVTVPVICMLNHRVIDT